MHNECRHCQRIEHPGCQQIEVAEAVPNALLNAAGDAKRREVVREGRIGEIPGDAQLERPLAIGVGVAVAEIRRGEVRAKFPDRGAALPCREFSLERAPEQSIGDDRSSWLGALR